MHGNSAGPTERSEEKDPVEFMEILSGRLGRTSKDLKRNLDIATVWIYKSYVSAGDWDDRERSENIVWKPLSDDWYIWDNHKIMNSVP